MTPKTERGGDFIQIGFAPMNPSGPTQEEYPPLPDQPAETPESEKQPEPE